MSCDRTHTVGRSWTERAVLDTFARLGGHFALVIVALAVSASARVAHADSTRSASRDGGAAASGSGKRPAPATDKPAASGEGEVANVDSDNRRAAEPVASTSRALYCAVEGNPRPLRAADICKALERRLGRSLSSVSDARKVEHGDAVQLIHDDVQWVVIWLSDGRIRAWTRVSKLEASDNQLKFLARATEELAKSARASSSPEPRCVRLDPNAGHKMRSNDLSYPWAELKPCERRLIEVVDPWWVPRS